VDLNNKRTKNSAAEPGVLPGGQLSATSAFTPSVRVRLFSGGWLGGVLVGCGVVCVVASVWGCGVFGVCGFVVRWMAGGVALGGVCTE